MKIWKIEVEFKIGKRNEKSEVVYTLFSFGRDFLLLIGGGEPHIGSLAGSDKERQKIHHYTLEKHKEENIVTEAAREIYHATDCEILVVGGIHYEHITTDQIQTIERNCRLLRDKIINWINTN